MSSLLSGYDEDVSVSYTRMTLGEEEYDKLYSNFYIRDSVEGLINGSTDVRDYYKLLLKDDYSYYQYDGKWLETDMRLEEIIIRDGEPFIGTV